MPKINYVGVDLSKLDLVADLAAEAKPRAFTNLPEGHAELIAALPQGAHVVCESTGGYQRALVAALHEAKVPVSVVMPGRVRAFAKARGLRAKTDPIDAKLLGTFGEALRPAALRAADPVQQELQALARARQALLEQLNDEASQAEHCTLALLQKQAAARGKWLRDQVREIERRIRALLKASETQHWRAERVQEVDGIGEITAWTVLAEMPELGTLDEGQPGALLGVVPDPDDSGPRHGKRHISGGRSHARRVLYMAALTASQRNPVLAPFYRRLVEKHHKPPRVALTAVMRKLIELINRLLADPEFTLAS